MILYCSAVPAELGDLPGEPVGIGLLDALLATAALVARVKPTAVVFVGTAGALPGSGVGIGDVITAQDARLGDAALALGLGYSPRHPVPLDGHPLPGLRAARVVTNVAITTDPALAARYGQDAQVEHMELYGVALACVRAGVPWAGVLGITNAVGPGAHAQWVANRAACERAARGAARAAEPAASLAGWPGPR